PLPEAGLKSITFETWIGASRSITPPGWLACGFGLVWRLTRFTLDTTTLSPWTLTTSPRLPLSLPAVTTTWSPFLIRFISLLLRSEHFGCERDDLHELLGAQLTGHGPEDARADRLMLVVQQHRGVAVEADQRTVGPAHALAGAHHDGVVDLALLDLAARDRVLDRHLDDVADVRVATLGTAKHLDAHHFLGARVVGHVEVALHLDHCKASLFGRAGEDLDHAPVLGLGQRRALGHADHVAGVAGVVGVVGVQLGRAADVLAVQRVLDLALHEHRHRLVHLVADHAAFDRVQLLAIVLGHLSPVLTSSHRAGCSRARSRGAPGGLRGSWQAGRWPSACAGRTAPCAARPGGPAALPPTSDASASCPSAHRPGHELGGHRELGGGQAERLARGRLVDALDLVDHAARLDLRDPVLDVALAGAHADLDGLLGDRLVGEHADPHLAAALDVAADRAACRLDLARGQLPGGGRLQPV